MARPETFPTAADAGLTLEPAASPESLLERLALALEASGIAYCQWKGHWSSHRWATGHGDVDLLVSREYLPRFRALVGGLGFKPALPEGDRALPGIEHYFGHDPAIPRLLHLHVHYQLMLGDYWKPVYRIPLGRELLEGSVAGRPFRIPAPTLQFLLFVLRLMLRQVGRPVLSLHNRWISGVQIQLESLEAGSDRQELAAFLSKLNLEGELFHRCVRSLRGEAGRWERAVLPWLLHRRLRAHARRPSIAALCAAAIEKLFPAYASQHSTPRLSGGGAVVALVGGDGAGKSTCARELRRWLSPALRTTQAHLGNPPKSLTTLIVGAALKVEQRAQRLRQRPHKAAGLLELLRHLCTARDRYRLYVRVQQFAAAGGVAICERYPVEENYPLAGPVIPQLLSGKVGPAADWLRQWEADYYARIQRPDALCVLRLDPEIAVLRKPDEPAEYVRARGRIVWETDWSSTGARVVEADRSLPEVLERLKAIIWSVL